MWIITYRGRPATMQTLCDAHGKTVWNDVNPESAIACRTFAATTRSYVHYFGFTWPDRLEDVGIMRVNVS